MKQPCGLCQIERQVVDSHLIPAGFYRLARVPGRKNSNPVIVNNGRASTTSKQISDYFLCKSCEALLNEGGEDFVLKWCSRGRHQFKLGDLIKELPTVGASGGGEIKRLGEAERQIAVKLGYFAASVFWRAAARSWKFNNRRFKAISLGPYEEEFRTFLLNQSQFPRNASLMMQVSSDPIVGNYTFSPRTSRNEGLTRHKFCVPGMIFTIFVGKTLPEANKLFELAPNCSTILYGPLLEDDWYRQGLSDMSKAERVGKLGKTR